MIWTVTGGRDTDTDCYSRERHRYGLYQEGETPIRTVTGGRDTIPGGRDTRKILSLGHTCNVIKFVSV